MYFPALNSWGRQCGRWLVYEVFQLALWAALAFNTLGSLRSALGGGSGARRGAGRAIRPRRPKKRRRAGLAIPTPAC